MEDHLHGIAIPSDPTVSPDGRRAAFVVSIIDCEEDRYRRQLWITDGTRAYPFTTGASDTNPSWSPDGSRLAFLREVDGVAQLAVIPVDGGEPLVVTGFALGVSGLPVWRPDGGAIAVVGLQWREGWADLDEEERRRRPRRIVDRNYRADGQGWIHDRRRAIYIVDPAGGSDPAALTDAVWNESAPAWSPDGSEIAFLCDAAARPGYDPGLEIVEADATSGESRRRGERGVWATVGYRPDGVLHAIGHPGTHFPELPLLWRLDPELKCVNESHARAVYTFTAGVTRLVFAGDRAIVSDVDSGSVGVIAVDPDGKVEDLVSGRSVVSAFDHAGGTTVATLSTVDSPGQVLISRIGESSTLLEEFGGRRPGTVTPEHFVVEAPEASLDVWVYLPPGTDRVPLLLNIHGGPAAQYGWGYFDEFQVYAGAGYGVIATNPRGSGGRDRDFLRAVTGEGWGSVDVEDIDAVVEASLRRFQRLDGERMGVMGGSYGGFLTAWLTAHQDRWRTAIVERALLSWPSFKGTSDIGGWFEDRYLGDSRLGWERSPQRVASEITTPTLIIHSEDDFRCPMEQAEQFFDALVRNGVEAEFVRFPGEGHELSRSGKPRHRQERFEIILDWLSRRL